VSLEMNFVVLLTWCTTVMRAH